MHISRDENLTFENLEKIAKSFVAKLEENCADRFGDAFEVLVEFQNLFKSKKAIQTSLESLPFSI